MSAAHFRNSARLVPARLVRNAWRIAVLVIALRGWGSQLPGAWPTILAAVVVLAAVAYVLEPISAVVLKRLLIEPHRVVMHAGLITPTERSGALAAVSSVQIDEPWDLRVFRLCSVTIVAQGAESSAFVMEGLTRQEAHRLMALVDRPATGSEPHATPEADEAAPAAGKATEADAPLTQEVARFRYVATPRDLFATIGSHGTLFIAGAAVFGLADSVASFVGVDLRDFSALDARTLSLVAGTVVVASGALAALTFRGFTIESADGATYRIAYGAVGRTSHTILADHVVAVALVTTPLDALLGTQRVSLSTARLRQSSSGEVKFPSIRRHEAARVVREITGAQLPELDPATAGTWLIVPAAVLSSTIAVVMLLPHPSVWIAAAEVLVVLVAAVGLARYVTGRVRISDDGSHLVWTEVGLAHSVTLYSAVCARGVVMRRVPPLPWGHLTVIGFAHRRHVLRKPVASGTALTEIRRFQQRGNTRPWSGTTVEVEL